MVASCLGGLRGFGPSMNMSASESGNICMFADPLPVEISAWMIGAVAGSCGWG